MKLDMVLAKRMAKQATESMMATGKISDLLLKLAANAFVNKKMIPGAFLLPMAMDSAGRIENLAANLTPVDKINSCQLGPRRVRHTTKLILEQCGVTIDDPLLFNGFANAVSHEASFLAKQKNQWTSDKQARKQLRTALESPKESTF